MPDVRMRRKAFRFSLFVLGLLLFGATTVRAQDPPPHIPWFVVDAHGSVPRFPSDDSTLAASRGMQLAELPGRGWGLQLGAHFYPLRWRVITFGVGGEFAVGRAAKTPSSDDTTGLRPAEETFRTIHRASFNSATAMAGAIEPASAGRRGVVPEGQEDYPPDSETLKTINYGAGARWFIKDHLAFSFDVRFYAINPGTPFGARPGSPRTTLLVIGAGVSVK